MQPSIAGLPHGLVIAKLSTTEEDRMPRHRRDRFPQTRVNWLRTLLATATLAAAGLVGVHAGTIQAEPVAAPAGAPAAAPPLAPAAQAAPRLPALRLYGDTTVCSTCDPGQANRPSTAGSNTVVDPNTGNVPEDSPYTDSEGPFNPLSPEAPEFDYVTWDPAWIYEGLDDPALMAEWPGLAGIDEVSRASNIRAGGINGSEKVWLRHWYEPTHLDKDLNADDCLTDDDIDGVPDARLNPDDRGADEDEWYPAIMTEITYMLLDNDVPQRLPRPADLDDSAPRPACGVAGGTRMIFPAGVALEQADPTGPAEGFGLTRLDVDFDDAIDMVNVTSEAQLAADLGVDVDFDGDGVLDDIDSDGTPLSCDEMVVLHSDPVTIGITGTVQFLDHFVRVRSVSNSSVNLTVYYNGDLQPRALGGGTIGVGRVGLAGDVDSVIVVPPAGNLGTVPIGPWFVHVDAVDSTDGTVTLTVGRALGAPCASMENAPSQPNRSAGGPWFLKRMYVDGHEYNVVAIMSCDTDEFQYITLRAPLPKVPVTIEQHSVRLEPYAPVEALALPPPFNYEHTILEDVVALEAFDDLTPELGGPSIPRPTILYMGGPIGPVAPVLGKGDPLGYAGRDPDNPVGPYNGIADFFASRWFYTQEDVEPAFVGQLSEKYGAVDNDDGEQPGGPPGGLGASEGFFYNEQIFTRPWNYTAFVLPNQPDPDPGPGGEDPPFNADGYYVTSGWINPYARWRRWSMPDGGVPSLVPPIPPDLTDDNTSFDPITGTYGAPRRASWRFDPDETDKILLDEEGVRLFGGFPLDDEVDCSNGAGARPSIVLGAGDADVLTDPVSGSPVEILPYTDPFAPFNPQHPDAPRTDSLTFNPAYMDEFRNTGEPELRPLYQQLANNGQNAREKVYHRTWYQPDYVTKIRDADDCDDDLSFLALVQEYTFLMMDTTDNPVAIPPGTSRMALPIATRADELPRPNAGGTLPAGGEFGYGLTTFDGDFDGIQDAVTVHSEETVNALLDQLWQSNRPMIPGFPVLPLPGPLLDFDGDGVDDDLDEDCTSLNGNEMAVFTLESIALQRGQSAMLLDHLVTLENITAGSRAQVRFYFTGGNPANARPEAVGGVRSLDVGDAAIVDRFQDSVLIVRPGQTNLGTDGAWFAFVEDVDTGGETVTLTIGRALGAAHSAIDDGVGGHDLAAGDPWYLKRFYVDGHEYNVVALMTQTARGNDPLDPAECNENFAFITLRTPVPKGNFFNPQDSLFQQGYFLDGLPAEVSVLPPFNFRHTIAQDIQRIDALDFANASIYASCVGALAAADPLVETIVDEAHEPRFGTELRETYNDLVDPPRDQVGWETHQTIVTPWNFTELNVPEGQQYLLTLNWRSPAGRLAFYGCTRQDPGPFDEDDPPGLSHADIAGIALGWRSGIIPPVNQVLPPQTRPELPGGELAIVPYYDATCSVSDTVRVKIFYDPADADDLLLSDEEVILPITEADIRLQKGSNATTANAGEDLTYTIDVTNGGPDNVPEVNVRDLLPPGATYLFDSDSCVEAPPGQLTCTLGPLAAGATTSFDLTVRLDPSLATDTAVVNLAEAVLPLTLDPDLSNNFDDHVVSIGRLSDLRVVKTASTAAPVAGQAFSYEVTVFNDGPSDASAVTMRDPLPAGVTFLSHTGGSACQLHPGNVVDCFWPLIAVGDSRTVTINVRANADVPPGTILRNEARVFAPSDDPDPTNDTDDATGVVVARADLRMTKEASGSPIPAGGTVVYTLTVQNLGPSDAPGVVIQDTLPAGTTFVSAAGASCGGVAPGGTGTLTCNLGTVAVGATRVVTLTVQVDPNVPSGTVIANVATVSSPNVTDPVPADNTDVAPFETFLESDMSVVKTGPATAAPGSQIDTTLTVRNNGPSNATGVTVVDTLPAGMTFVSSSVPCVPLGGGQYECSVGNLAAGAQLAIIIRVAISGAAADGTILTNQASVSATPLDPDATNDQSSHSVTIVRQADLSIAKTLLNPPAVAGGTATFQIAVQNGGPSSASGVVVVDQLPAGMTFVSSSGACASTAPPAGEVTCTVGTVAVGATVTFTITVQIDGGIAAGTTLTNNATVAGAEPDPTPGNNAVALPVVVQRRADLRLIKDAAPNPVVPGSQLVYTVTVTNGGPSSASGVVVVDQLPAGVTFVSSTGGCASSAPPAGELTCNVGTLASGASASFTITVLVGAAVGDGIALLNSATASSPTTDPDPSNNADTATVVTDAQADLRIAKTASPTTVTAGGQVTYTLTVGNGGPSSATNVVVVDVLPAGLTFVSSPSGCFATPPPAGEVTCNIGTLAPGATVVATIVAQVAPSVPAGTVLTNSAAVTAGPDDPDPGNDSDDAPVTVQTRADVGVTKTAPTTVEPGETIVYNVTVSNAGPSDALAVTVVDILPPGVTFVSSTGGCAATAPPVGEVTCNLGTLAPGAVVNFSITGTVGGAVPDGTLLNNDIAVSTTTTDPDPSDDSDTASTTVMLANEADLSIVKTALLANPAAGEQFAFQIAVTNNGPRPATNATVVDVLPAGLTFVSSTGGCIQAPVGTLTCNVGTISVGATAIFTITVQAAPFLSEGAVVTNGATVDSDLPDPDLSDNADDASVTITRRADLAVSKDDAVDPIRAGSLLTYTVHVTNTGPSSASNVIVTDTLPAGTSYVSSTVPCASAPGNVRLCSVGALAAGAMTSFQIVVMVPSNANAGVMVNQVAVGSLAVDPDPSDNSDAETTIITTEAALSMDKSVSHATRAPGDVITYTLQVTNIGPSDAVGVQVTDVLPAGVTYVSDDAGCDTSGLPTMVCTLGTLPAGGIATVTIVVTIDLATPPGTALLNTATVDASTADPDAGDDEDTTTTTVVSSSDLAVTKTAVGEVILSGNPPSVVLSPGAVTAGRRVTYTLEVTNDGPSPATGVVLVDTLPAGVVFISAPGCTTALPQVNCAIGGLASGASAIRTIVVDIPASTPDGTVRTNTVTATGAQPDPDSANNTASAPVTVNRRADLAVSKAASPDMIAVGGTVTFTLTVTNTGPSDAIAVTLVDTLPAGLAFASAGPGCSAVGQTVTCSIGALAAGATAVRQILATAQPGTEGQTLTNGVTASSSTIDPQSGNDADTADVDVSAAVDLSVVKTASAQVVTGPPPTTTLSTTSVTAGGLVTYTLTVANAGPSAATAVELVDTLPVSTTLVSASGAICILSAGVLTCDLGSLPSGGSAVVVIVLEVEPGAPLGAVLTNEAAVDAAELDLDPSDDQDAVDLTVGVTADLGLIKEASPAPVGAGSLLTYTLTVANAGPSVGHDVTISDTLLAGLTVVSADPLCSLLGLPLITCDLGDIAPGGSISVTLVTQVGSGLAGTVITNTAEAVLGIGLDPDPTDDSDSASKTVQPVADLAIIKSAEGQVVQSGSPPVVVEVADAVTAGGLLTYTLSVTNNGPDSATSVVLTDVLPGNVSLISAAGCNTASLPTITCSIGTLANGASAVRTIVVQVDPDAPGGVDIVNAASVDAAVLDNTPGNDGDSVAVDVSVVADLALVKTASAGSVVSGGSLTYTLSVQNLGPSYALGVVVTDTLPVSGTVGTLPAGCSESGGVVTCTLPDLAPGGNTFVEFPVSFPSVPVGGDIDNTATVSLGVGIDPDPSNDTSSTTTPVIAFVAFNAQSRGATDVDLTWETESEDGVFGFRVFRFAAEQDTWVGFGTRIPARGIAGDGASYRMTDRPGPGTHAYRLVMYRLDGTMWEYGPVRVRMLAIYVPVAQTP